MRRRRNRHPALEAAVFAAALLLAAFVGRELWNRRGPASAQEPSAMEPVKLNPSYPSLAVPGPGGRTEAAVTGVAPLKLTRVQRRRSKTAVVPSPK